MIEPDPLPTVRALRQKWRPNAPLRELAADSHGLSLSAIEQIFSRADTVKRIPAPEVIRGIAGALSCAPQEVFAAFATDLGHVYARTTTQATYGRSTEYDISQTEAQQESDNCDEC
jgi:hypothetical protein